MVSTKLKIATRASPLALRQTEEALTALRTVLPDSTVYEILTVTTPGDRNRALPLAHPDVSDNFFTRDIDEALLNGEADIAIHSAKDLPDNIPEGLNVAAYLPAKDIRDALVLRRGIDPGSTPRTIGTSSPRRTEYLRECRPDARLKPLRGTIQERLEQLDRGEYDTIVVAACALERLGLAARIGEYLPYDPAPQQGRLAVVTRNDPEELRASIGALDVRAKAGLVALVGCPADISLLSQRAQQYIKHADIVLYDRLLPDEILLSIQSKAVAVGKAGGHPAIEQIDIHRTMLAEVEKGHLVVRLQGGDPCIYGHLGEEFEFLTEWNIRLDIVTTPTAAQIASAHARAPLTHRGDGGHVTFIPGHAAKERTTFEIPGPQAGNLAIYMGVNTLTALQTKLKEQGWADTSPVVIGQRLGYKDEAIIRTTLMKAHRHQPETPAVFLIGTRHFPVTGWTLFVGTDPEHFLKHGPLLHWPLLRLVSRPLEERVRHLREKLRRMDGILFPSRYAVRSCIEALTHWKDTRVLAGQKLLAVGPATAEELSRFGLIADETADAYGGVQSLTQKITPELHGAYLYPCSDAAPREDRIQDLQRGGITLHPCTFYSNRHMPYRTFPNLPIERVLFTSTSSVNYYFELYPEELREQRTWLAVGTSTLKAIEKYELKGQIL